MIDLRERDLPDSIKVDGRSFRLNTDFRAWIRFDHNLQHHRMYDSCVFADELPDTRDAVEPLMEFYHSPNVTPRKSSSSSEMAVDFVWDGDYIVASFMQAYGIDLTTVEYMHWHVFKALLFGLPSDTILGQIMGFRTYSPSKKKYEESMRDQKRKWTLPTIDEIQEREKLLEWAEEMGL